MANGNAAVQTHIQRTASFDAILERIQGRRNRRTPPLLRRQLLELVLEEIEPERFDVPKEIDWFTEGRQRLALRFRTRPRFAGAFPLMKVINDLLKVLNELAVPLGKQTERQ